MALAILNDVVTGQGLSAERVLHADQWQTLKALPALRQVFEERASEAIEQAKKQAVATLEFTAAEAEKKAHKALLLKALSLQMEYERLKEELSGDFVEAVQSCVKALIGTDLPQQFYSQILQSARTLYGNDAEIVLNVPASDQSKALQAIAGTNLALRCRISVVPDLQPTECFLETKFGRVQASLDAQLEALFIALERWWERSNHGSAEPLE